MKNPLIVKRCSVKFDRSICIILFPIHRAICGVDVPASSVIGELPYENELDQIIGAIMVHPRVMNDDAAVTPGLPLVLVRTWLYKINDIVDSTKDLLRTV